MGTSRRRETGRQRRDYLGKRQPEGVPHSYAERTLIGRKCAHWPILRCMKVIDANHFLIRASLNRTKTDGKRGYPFDLPLIRNMEPLEFHPAVTFIVGENGSGKSTLLEAIAVGMGFNAEGGSRNFNFATMESHSQLTNYLDLVKGIRRPRDGFFMRAESFYNVASEIQRLDAEPGSGGRVVDSYGGASLHHMSHGESFMALLEHRFGSNGFYLLDEPEAALSPARQLSMLALLKRHTNAGSQFIIVTHSPILLGFPDADIHVISDGLFIKTAYNDTEPYKLTKYFLDNSERMLGEILSADE